MDILNQDFVTKVRTTLEELSKSGPVTKKTLASALNLKDGWDDVFTLMLKNGLLPGFITRKGKFGGFVKTGFVKFGQEEIGETENV